MTVEEINAGEFDTLRHDGFSWKNYLQFEKNYTPSRISHLFRKADFPLQEFSVPSPKKYIHEYIREKLHTEFKQLSLMWNHSISFWLSTLQKKIVREVLIQGLQRLFDLGITSSRHSPLTVQAHSLHPQKTFPKYLEGNSLLSIRHQ